MQIQYLGFQLKAHGRDYTYRVINPKAENREFIFSISNRTFVEAHLPYQDAAYLCYQKLQKALDIETADQPFPRCEIVARSSPNRNSMSTWRSAAPPEDEAGKLVRSESSHSHRIY